jgi:hypothetical protein
MRVLAARHHPVAIMAQKLSVSPCEAAAQVAYCNLAPPMRRRSLTSLNQRRGSSRRTPLCARSRRAKAKDLSRSLDTIVYGESTMFMAVNGGQFLGSRASPWSRCPSAGRRRSDAAAPTRRLFKLGERRGGQPVFYRETPDLTAFHGPGSRRRPRTVFTVKRPYPSRICGPAEAASTQAWRVATCSPMSVPPSARKPQEPPCPSSPSSFPTMRP